MKTLPKESGVSAGKKITYESIPVHLWWEILLEKDRTALEDVCRVGPTNDAWHIKVSWASVVKGVNLQLL